MMTTTIGVLALQGDVAEHKKLLHSCDVKTLEVKTSSDLDKIDGLVIPGGESHVIEKLAKTFGVFQPLQDKIATGMPVYGTCAGMIMLARDIVDGTASQTGLSAMDITVRRNAFGRQVDSYEEYLEFQGIDHKICAVFIRAPWVESVGDKVEILAKTYCRNPQGNIVAVKQDNMLATSFHPELIADNSVHRYFVNMCL